MFLEYIGTGSDLLHEDLPLLAGAHLDALLNDIVPVAVSHHVVEGAVQLLPARVLLTYFVVVRAQDLVNDLPPIAVAPVRQALLNHVARVLVVAQIHHFAFDASYDAVLVLGVPSLLQDMLNNIVSELVIRQVVEVLEDRLQDRLGLLVLAVLQDALDHTAAVGVHAELAYSLSLFSDSADNEVDSLIGKLLDALLDHMVPVLVIDAVQHGVLKLLNKQLLLIEGDELQSLLHDATAIHGLRQLED